MSNKDRGILLDTHTWIWLVNGTTELSTEAITLIDRAGSKGRVFISVISTWELSMLVAKNRITLTKPINKWVEDSLNQSGVNLALLTPEIAIESSFLPGQFHGDPADRVIVATARIESLILLTRDTKIINYGKDSYLSCLKI